jgi:hypothetical protein
MILNILIQKFFVGLAELNLHQIIYGQLEVSDAYSYEMVESNKTMEFFFKLPLTIPVPVSLVLGLLGVLCFLILFIKKPNNPKVIVLLTTAYTVGGLAFLPLMVNILNDI